MFGPRKDEESKQFQSTREASHYKEPGDLYMPTCIFRVDKSRKLLWLGCGAGVDILYFVWRTLRKDSSRIGSNDNIKMDLSNSVVKIQS